MRTRRGLGVPNKWLKNNTGIESRPWMLKHDSFGPNHVPTRLPVTRADSKKFHPWFLPSRNWQWDWRKVCVLCATNLQCEARWESSEDMGHSLLPSRLVIHSRMQQLRSAEKPLIPASLSSSPHSLIPPPISSPVYLPQHIVLPRLCDSVTCTELGGAQTPWNTLLPDITASKVLAWSSVTGSLPWS